MPIVDLGKVGMSLKGVYSAETQYEKLDVVYYDDSTYCAKVSTKGNTPSKEDDTYWQLLVAPNPLATWKPNTKTDEGYVEKGEGNEDKVWATDSEGNPAWREYSSDPAAIIDTNNWDLHDMGKIRLVAEVTVSPYEGNSSFQRVDFSSFCSKGDSVAIKGLIAGGLNRQSRGSDNSYLYRYSSSGMYQSWGILYKSQTSQADPAKFYLCTSYSGSTKITIYDFHKTYGITNVEWIFDQNKYVDTTKLNQSDYEYYGYSYVVSGEAYYPQPYVDAKRSGIVPSPSQSAKNNIFSTDSTGAPKWQSLDKLDLQTSAQVQEAISTAIASADFSSFEIVDSIPEPETAVENKFYLVKNEKTSHYDIYAKIGETVEWIDDTTVDLTDYATKEDLPTSVSELTNDANYTSLTEEQYNTLLQLLGEE